MAEFNLVDRGYLLCVDGLLVGGLPPFFGDGLFNHPHESEDVLPNLRPIELRQARRKGEVRPPIVVNCCDDAPLFNVTLQPVRDRGSSPSKRHRSFMAWYATSSAEKNGIATRYGPPAPIHAW